MYFLSNYLWEKNLRPINEDSLCLYHVNYASKPLLFCALCDGVGGLNHGEYASRTVINNLKEYFDNYDRTSSIRLNKIHKNLSRILYISHNALTRCATTVCLLVIYGNKGLIMSCGDSRIYGGKRRLKQLTKDNVDSKGRLTSVIGSGSFNHIPYRRFRVKSGDNFILCSDGFYKRTGSCLFNLRFGDCKSDEDIKNCLIEVYNTAVNNKESDNCSAIAICARKGNYIHE